MPASSTPVPQATSRRRHAGADRFRAVDRLEVVCGGKGKNNPLKWDAVPADYEAEAKART